MKALSILIFILFFAVSTRSEELQTRFPIKKELNNPSVVKDLNYPKSVKRFYASDNYRASWVASKSRSDQTFEAMLLLDCVSQYGLNADDFHPTILTYDRLHQIIENEKKLSDQQKARFDIALTDALITFINHLHYGKFNPKFTKTVVDKIKSGTFRTENVLSLAKKSKQFSEELLNVQPHIKEYGDLQRYMRLTKGQNSGDCYETPEAELKKIGINMERLRWHNVNNDNYILINIPSYTLQYHQVDSTYFFQIIVGKPTSKSPVLQSKINSIIAAPDRSVPQRSFINKLLPEAVSSPNYLKAHNITVYDEKWKYIEVNPGTIEEIKNSPEKYFARRSTGKELSLGTIALQLQSPASIYLFDPSTLLQATKGSGAITNGSIGVLKAAELADLLLKQDDSEGKTAEMESAAKKYLRWKYKLKTPVQLNIVYLTCLMKDGLPVYYKDIYQLDKLLEDTMYLHNRNIKINVY